MVSSEHVCRATHASTWPETNYDTVPGDSHIGREELFVYILGLLPGHVLVSKELEQIPTRQPLAICRTFLRPVPRKDPGLHSLI